MCNAYEQHVRGVEYCQMMQALELGDPTHQSELDLAASRRHQDQLDGVGHVDCRQSD
jgi:hypothetical protein